MLREKIAAKRCTQVFYEGFNTQWKILALE
jgi:hypothetical protein